MYVRSFRNTDRRRPRSHPLEIRIQISSARDRIKRMRKKDQSGVGVNSSSYPGIDHVRPWILTRPGPKLGVYSMVSPRFFAAFDRSAMLYFCRGRGPYPLIDNSDTSPYSPEIPRPPKIQSTSAHLWLADNRGDVFGSGFSSIFRSIT
jgi:hypothetical protein